MSKTNKHKLEGLGIDLKRIKVSGKTLCPKCSADRKKKKDPCLSVNIEEGVWNCHNCHWSGKVGNSENYTPEPKSYILPPFINTTECSDSTVQWFFKRGVTQSTLKENKVTESVEWMPNVKGKYPTINFNYFRDGVLVNTKYRGKKKSFRLVKDAELIFYGIDKIKDTETAILVEGEMDALSVWESGIEECVSVPNGASISNNANLQYLDNCIGYFENKKKIILATDNDEPGRALRDELARRLGYHRCYKVDFKDCKDANEYHVKYGSSKLLEVFKPENLIEFPIEGIIRAKSLKNELNDLFTKGLSRGDTTGTLREFDEYVSFVPGHLMVLTGAPNGGKSPFALQIMISLSLKHGWKWGIFSPEHKPLEIYLSTICEALLGKRMRKGIGFTEIEKELAIDFIDEHFIFIEPSDGDSKLDSVLEKAKELVLRDGIRGLIIDPWNKIEYQMERGENESLYISRQLDKIIRFDQTHHVFTIIVAHPTKLKKKNNSNQSEVATLYDIAGSANWANKPDWGLSFYRDYEENTNTIYIQKAKWGHLGKTGEVTIKYNLNNSRFSDLHAAHDNSNWLMPNAKQPEIFPETPEPVNFNKIGQQLDEERDIPF